MKTKITILTTYDVEINNDPKGETLNNITDELVNTTPALDGNFMTGMNAFGNITRTAARRVTPNDETILCAAIHYDDEEIYEGQPSNLKSGMVLSGYRHEHCELAFDAMFRMTNGAAIFIGNVIKGFLTSHNRFVGRREAYQIAKAMGQIHHTAHDPDDPNIELNSEDLYLTPQDLT